MQNTVKTLRAQGVLGFDFDQQNINSVKGRGELLSRVCMYYNITNRTEHVLFGI